MERMETCRMCDEGKWLWQKRGENYIRRRGVCCCDGEMWMQVKSCSKVCRLVKKELENVGEIK